MEKQRYRHNPAKGEYGDCHSACIANLLGMAVADVPHFCDRDDVTAAEFNANVRKFLAPLGYMEATVAFCADLEEVLLAMRGNGFYILGGTSKTGCNHSVIGRDGAIHFDPSLDDSGIVGPMDDGFYRVSFIAKQPEVRT